MAKSKRASVAELCDVLQRIAPLELAQSWDNVGLLAGDRQARVRRVMLCIDLMPAVVSEALRRKADMVVAYHPPLFRPITRLVIPSDGMEAGLLCCIARGIAVYSPHTALDVADGGTNDVLAAHCDVVDPQPLEPLGGGPRIEPLAVGIGRVGKLRKPISAKALAANLRRRCGAACISVVGDAARPRRRALIGVGAAGAMPFAVEVGRHDVIVTGEIRHHDALRIERVGAAAIALSHWSSERPTLEVLAARLAADVSSVEVTLSDADHEPFQRA
jgi:dinuclear metal center YbgI/SA1388 family protein